VALNSIAGLLNLNCGQSDLGSKLDLRFDPEFRLAVRMGNVNMRTTLFSGKEEQSEWPITNNCR